MERKKDIIFKPAKSIYLFHEKGKKPAIKEACS